MSEQVDLLRLQESVSVLQGMLANQVMEYSRLKVEESLVRKDAQALDTYCTELEEEVSKLQADKLQLEEKLNSVTLDSQSESSE